MNFQLVHQLAEAGASLEAALDHFVAGTPAWECIYDVIDSVEKLLNYEGTDRWPKPAPEPAPEPTPPCPWEKL